MDLKFEAMATKSAKRSYKELAVNIRALFLMICEKLKIDRLAEWMESKLSSK